MTISIEQVVNHISDWKEKTIAIYPLSGGLTNTNYRVEVEGTPYVIRIPGASTELLAVDRVNEHYNTVAAAQAGVGPTVVHYLADVNVMVLDFIHGDTMSIARLKEAGQPARIAQSLKKLHAGPRFLHDFNMFRLTEFYLKVVDEHEVRIPDRFRDYMPQVGRIEEAMKRHPLATVPCHNDLLAENYIDDGKMLWIVDYEYSGNNDPTFELGNTCQEQQYDETGIVEMCAAYFGEPYPDKLARMKLNMIMSDVGWTLWAAIQAKISTIDFDFWGWAVERWGRATAKMDGPKFEGWLAAV
ncbi:MAG: phosphotransferase family protein [Chloroflexi bacterium]|nr:phosphotransferase family protein [Chloroflexota bacterium]